MWWYEELLTATGALREVERDLLPDTPAECMFDSYERRVRVRGLFLRTHSNREGAR